MKPKEHGDEEIEDLQVSEGGRGHDPYDQPGWDGVQDPHAPTDAERGIHPLVDQRIVSPSVVQRGADATRHARDLFHSMDYSHHLQCLRFVRECLKIDSRYLTANQAWGNANHRVKFTSIHDIPFAAPVFSERPGGSAFGHVFLAGGKFKNGDRIFWTTDQFNDGRITPVRLSFFTDHWGHFIRGFTRDLNGVGIPYLLDKKGR